MTKAGGSGGPSGGSSSRTQPRPEELLACLASGDGATRLRGVRGVKNQIIGNKNKKLSYIKLGAVPAVIAVLRDCPETDGSLVVPYGGDLLMQSAATVGSFAYGTEDGVRAVIESGAVPQLVACLASSDQHVVENSLRALKMIYQSPLAPRDDLLSGPALDRLIASLHADGAVAAIAACLLARCATTPAQATRLVIKGAVGALLPLLGCPKPGTRAAALEALAAVTAASPDACRSLAADEAGIESVVALLKDPAPEMRLLASSCLADIAAEQPAPPARESSNAASTSTLREPTLDGMSLDEGPNNDTNKMRPEDKGPAVRQAIDDGLKKRVLLVLVKLMDIPSLQEMIPHVLARLMAGDATLQGVASDAGAIRKLSSLLAAPDASAALQMGAYECLAMLCMDREWNRMRLGGQPTFMRALAAGLASPSESVRRPAACCLRALSRSVKELRSTLLESDVVGALFGLLSDRNPEVQVTACAAMCNLCLQPTPIKEACLKAGALQRLVRLVSAPAPELRHNCCFALANMAFMASSSLKSSIMALLTWPGARALLADGCPRIKARALVLLRNLLYGPQNKNSDDIAVVFAWAGDELLPAVCSELEHPEATDEARVHALYIIVNIASGRAAHKASVMGSRIVAALRAALRDPNGPTDAKVAAAWALINLSWSREGDEDCAETRERIRQLRAAGVVDDLRALASHESQDLKERVKTALSQFQKAEQEPEAPAAHIPGLPIGAPSGGPPDVLGS